MASLKLEHVKKIYDKNVVAVHDFNLEIKDKEFIVFVGPSGCGKSTTLRMIAGLEDISEGTLTIGNRVVNDVEPKDRDIAMVFQNYALYPHITVYENMAFSLRLRKMDNEEVHRRVCEAAEILGITEYLTRKPKALSGGQRQRVAIGRANVREPKVLLMDEPLSNLDAKLRNQMRAEIIKLRQRIDTTFIYVTHDQTEAMTLGDRIVIMKDGFIQQIGTPQQVFDHPANIFVAGFIGMPQMNFFDAELVCEGDKYSVKVQNAVMELDADTQAKLKAAGHGSKAITLGIRPEHISITNASGSHCLTGKVDVSEMMGSEIHLHVNAGGRDVILRVPTTELSAENKAGFAFGTEISFTFPTELIHMFDKETEMNLLPLQA